MTTRLGYFAIAAGAAAITAFAAVLWAHAGDRVFIDRLVTAFVNCF